MNAPIRPIRGRQMRGVGFNPPATQGGVNGGVAMPPQVDLWEDFYVYSAALGNIAAAATVTVNIQIQADSDFEWIESTSSGNQHGASEPWLDNIILPINVQILDSGSGRQLFSQALPLTSISGNGKQPFILPVSRLFQSRSNIAVSAVNFGGSQYDNVVWNFIGRKIFQKG